MSLQNIGKVSRFLNGTIGAVKGMEDTDAIKAMKALGLDKSAMLQAAWDNGMKPKELERFSELIDTIGDTSEAVSGLDKLKESFTGLWEGAKSGFTNTLLPFLRTNWVSIADFTSKAVDMSYPMSREQYQRFYNIYSEYEEILTVFVVLQCLLQIDREQLILIVTYKLIFAKHLFDYYEYFVNIKQKCRPKQTTFCAKVAGAQGLELPLIQYFTSRNADFSPLSSEMFTIL